MSIKTLLFAAVLLMAALAVAAQLRTIPYMDGNQKLNGVLSAPVNNTDKGNGGILILPAWKGIDASSRKYALALTDSGYYAFIADIYGEGNYPSDSKEAGERSSFYKANRDQYRHRIQLALEQLVNAGADPDRIVIAGYCFGGLGAIEAARANMPVKGIVSFHGSYDRDTTGTIAFIKPKMLILHGNDDPYTSGEQLAAFKQELTAAKADWQMNIYANAVHAFTDINAGTDNAKGAAYNEMAAKRSWIALLQFIDECFGR